MPNNVIIFKDITSLWGKKIMSFVKAERKRAKIKLAITGPSGAGKTYSSLMLASGLGKNIFVIDTENDSASLYEDLIDFRVKNLKDTSVDGYINAIEEAISLGADVLILDSISHQWLTLLEEKTHVDARGGNSFTNWSKFSPLQERFMTAILMSNVHIIATIRSKQEYSLVQDGGKNKVQKLGMAPVQREGTEFNFWVVFDVAMNHEASVSKDRTRLFEGKIFKITKETGTKILTWLNSAKDIGPSLSGPSMTDIMKVANEKGFDKEQLKKVLHKIHGLDSSTDMDEEQMNEMYSWLKNNDVNSLQSL